ncbi:MAG: GNAT family N-acetyltransferase [Firmicutes bacterium HGW-Firmicutes-14]|nr:MAG: GNAT family N-acetyltransferase [Firmicutes bacterium HGW-Firmicutes-14]
MEIQIVESPQSMNLVRELFVEYATSLHIDLYLYGFGQELDTLPGNYTPPSGRLLLAIEDGEIAGCIALRKLNETDCEMKRLYVRAKFRGCGIGKKLTEAIISEAKGIGYTRMFLDTFINMKAAVGLHKSLGFKITEPYYYNPLEGAIFMVLDL